MKASSSCWPTPRPVQSAGTRALLALLRELYDSRTKDTLLGGTELAARVKVARVLAAVEPPRGSAEAREKMGLLPKR